MSAGKYDWIGFSELCDVLSFLNTFLLHAIPCKSCFKLFVNSVNATKISENQIDIPDNIIEMV